MRSGRLILLFLGLLLSGVLQATHNRAGEITYRYLGGFQYEATIITYTKSDSPADRPNLGISWGDGLVDTIPRINGNGQGELLANSIKKNIYVGIHTYPGPSIYTLSFEDPNRNGGLVNIPNSVNIPFYVSTQLVINPFLGVNNSVQLLNPPIDEACAGQIFIHNPGAFDPDGDSISYRIIECRGEDGLVIPGFTQPSASSSFTLDAITGDLIWDAPLPGGVGEYNVAFVIEEWRNGFLVGFVTRDMQINVVPCSNQPPQIVPLPDLCVDAGTILNFPVSASDPDSPAQSITLSASGGPFQFPAPGNAVFAGVTQLGAVTQQFVWETSCVHVRKQPYQFSFKVIDNGNPNLADFESMSIRVVAQAPANLQAQTQGSSIQLTWEISPCDQAVGYAVYRRSGFYGYTHGPCETGVPSYTGYQFLSQVNGLNSLSYTDPGPLLPGASYCYMVIAVFADGAESYASNEACVQLDKILPVITNVSINTTNATAGLVDIAWSKPTAINTDQFPGPYRYIIERAQGLSGTTFIAIDSLISLNDTTYTDASAGVNTISNAWSYRIRLRNVSPGNEVLMGQSQAASSVFLQASGSDNQINLSWQAQVPWTNDSFVVYRKLASALVFDSIGVTPSTSYQDIGLANGVAYCYKVKSIGKYSGTGFVDPILNFSQEVCTSAKDMQSPCAPQALVEANCDSLSNTIRWQFPNDTACYSDVVLLRIYYSTSSSSEWQLLNETPMGVLSQFVHLPGNSIAGCYAVAAVDSFMNESELMRTCVDNCPKYDLPNTFSPNGDGFNDVFHPFPYAYIASVDIHIYNRWGTELYSTNDPNINWNGSDTNGLKVTDGVYFYAGEVVEIRLDGNISRSVKGTIQLFGTSQKSGN
ncbi:MAG: hypothetical protein RLZZ543_1639 [Bacteroidota bacterium]|jgi:gliding motility-associated-like protein